MKVRCENPLCKRFRIKGLRWCVSCKENTITKLESTGTLTKPIQRKARADGSAERTDQTRNG